MSDVIFSVLFFVVIFCFLTYSCQWFGRTLKRYQDARRAFDEHQRQAEQNPSTGFSVYTIENGRRTLINYHTEQPPRSPAHLVMKQHELPPTYEDALNMPVVGVEQVVVVADNQPNPNTATSSQRRNSSTL